MPFSKMKKPEMYYVFQAFFMPEVFTCFLFDPEPN